MLIWTIEGEQFTDVKIGTHIETAGKQMTQQSKIPPWQKGSEKKDQPRYSIKVCFNGTGTWNLLNSVALACYAHATPNILFRTKFMSSFSFKSSFDKAAFLRYQA